LLLLLFGPAWAEQPRKGQPFTLCEFWKSNTNTQWLYVYCPAFQRAVNKQWVRQTSIKSQIGMLLSPPDKNGVIVVTIAGLDKEDRFSNLQLPTSPVTNYEIRQYAKAHAAELLPGPPKKKK
jgi:hypothetical protein